MILIFDAHVRWLIIQSLIYLGHLIAGLQKIFYLINVYFLKGRLNTVFLRLKFANDSTKCSWNYALRIFLKQRAWICSHRIGFTASCLAIRENADIMAVQKRLNQMLNFVVHINLILIRSKHLVKEEHILLWLPSLIIGYLQLNLLIIMYFYTFLYLLK
jgi:hypothetical protein